MVEISELYDVWRDAWLRRIERQIYEMNHRREIHDGLGELLQKQAHPDGSYFWDVFHGMYLEAQVMAIRRQADRHTRTVSLRRLIGQIEHHRAAITRTHYVARWMRSVGVDTRDESGRQLEAFHLGMANDSFDLFTDKSGGETISAGLLKDDRDRLVQISEKVTRFADQVVAHADIRPTDELPTYRDFDASLDLLGDLLQRYSLLISQTALATVTPAIQGDWRGPFRTALATPEH